MANYSQLENKNGTIVNKKTGKGYATPTALAADLGVAPHQIQWGNISKASPSSGGGTSQQQPTGQAPTGQAPTTNYSQLTQKGGVVYKGDKAYGDPTELAADLGIQPHEIDWSQVQSQQPQTQKPLKGDQTPQPAQQAATAPTGKEPSLIEITSQRPDVMAEAKKQGGDPYTAGTPANTWLNDWYNKTGKAEGADMASKGMFDQASTGQQPTGQVPTEQTPTQKVEEISTESKDKTAKLNEEWTTKFEGMKKEMDTTYQETQKKQDDLLTKMGETANTELLSKFEDMQKGIMESYNKYFDEQADYLKTMQEQPSSVEQLQKFREEQGLPQMEQILAGIDQTIIDTENLLKNVEDDIRTRTEGLPVSEAAARRLTAMEQAPLSKQLTGLITSRQRAAAGLSAKQQTVQSYMTAQQADIQRQKDIAGARLGFAGEKAELGKDMQTQAFDLFSNLQNKMVDINKMRFEQAGTEADYKNQLAQQGFSFFSQMQAQRVADARAEAAGELDFIHKQALKEEEFQKELILMQFESELKAANPNVKSVQNFTDAQGNVSVMTTYTDGSSEMISLGKVGKGFKATGGGGGGTTPTKEFTRVKQIVAQHPNEWGHAADQIDREFGVGTATKYDDYLKETYAEKPEEEETGSKWEREATVWQWLETDEAKNLSDEEKASQIRSYGLNPQTFSIY